MTFGVGSVASLVVGGGLAVWIVVGCYVALAELGTRRIRSLEFDAESPAHSYLLDALCHRTVQPPYVGAALVVMALPFRRRLPDLNADEFVNSRGPAPA